MFSNGGATWLVPIMLLGWPLIATILFVAMKKPRRAVLWCCLIDALFLPEGGYALHGFPDYSKYSALSVVLLLAILLDGGRPLRVRPSWIDIPMFVWCAGRFASSLSNGLGAYDGLSTMVQWLVTFGLPYWLGRTYFSEAEGIRELARGILIGGLLYAPLCLFEVRFSPQLHAKLYGFMTVPFYMILRYGGYRPMVFMNSSLGVAMWMSASTVITWWLAHSGALRRIWGIPTQWVSYGLLFTVVVCKARGALALALLGIGLFYATRTWKRALPFALMLGMVASYPALRGSGLVDADAIKDVASLAFGPERVASLGVRLRSEDMYIEHASDRWLLGWGGFGRGEVVVDGVRSIPDGLWVIALSRAGWLAVVALMGLYLIPPFLLIRRHPARTWTTPEFAPIAVSTILLVLYFVDCLSNAMVTPVLVVAIGAGNGWFAVAHRPYALAAGADVPTVGAPEPTLVPTPPAAPSLARSLRGPRKPAERP